MAGIISGFIGGLSKGIADVGRMEFDNQMKNEREESSYLRDKELAGSKRKYLTSERVAGEKFTAKESTKKITAKSKGTDKPTNNIKNVRFLMSEEGGKKPLKEAIMLSFPGSKIKHTDEEGNIRVATPDGKGGFESVFTWKKDEKGNPVLLNAGEELPNAEITKLDRKEAADKADEKSGFWKVDAGFPSTKGDKELFKKQESQRIANKRRAAKKGGGLVNNAMKDNADALETKRIGTRKVSKAEFIRRAKMKYPNISESELKSDWDSIGK